MEKFLKSNKSIQVMFEKKDTKRILERKMGTQYRNWMRHYKQWFLKYLNKNCKS